MLCDICERPSWECNEKALEKMQREEIISLLKGKKNGRNVN